MDHLEKYNLWMNYFRPGARIIGNIYGSNCADWKLL